MVRARGQLSVMLLMSEEASSPMALAICERHSQESRSAENRAFYAFTAQ